MNKHPSCSFHSSQSIIHNLELQTKEQSILKQYNKVMQSSEPPQYSQQALPYSELPKFITQEVRNLYSQCIYLDKFTFYEMFTVLIVEYLFKDIDQRKMKKILHFKSLLYSAQFLQGSLFTKGLIIKGFKSSQQISNSPERNIPLGQPLLNCDSICAFTECWKQLVRKICEENNMPVINENQIDSSIFQLFASYFHVNFDVYWKEKGNRLWKQQFKFQGSNKDTDTLVVIVNPEYQISVSQRSIKVSESRASGTSSSNKTNNCWNYLILTNPPKKTEKEPKVAEKQSQKSDLANGEEISRISEVSYSCGETQEIKILLEQKGTSSQTAKKTGKFRKGFSSAQEALSNILSTMSKANSLIEEMRKYSQQLQRTEHIDFCLSQEIFSGH